MINDKSSQNQEAPCLGLAWSNLITTRLTIQRTKTSIQQYTIDNSNNQIKQSPSMTHIRRAELTFSPEMPYGNANFIITQSNGVCSV